MSSGPASGSSSFATGGLTPNSAAAARPYAPPRRFWRSTEPVSLKGHRHSLLRHCHILLWLLTSALALFTPYFCYHAATRTGQFSPILPRVRSRLCYGFLWG